MADAPKTIEFELDGVVRAVPEGTSVLEAAALHGVEIPHFCYHPGLGVDGNCRLCLVEIEGARGLQISCNVKVAPGMQVRVMSDAARKARRDTLEFLLINHPIDCPICDQAGECKLQDYYAVLGPYDSRFAFAKVRKHKRVELGADVMLDQERCVLCARCTRFMKDVAGDEQLVIANRGDHSEITTFPGQPLDSEYAGNVVDVCPVGALTNQRHRFQTRAWMLTPTKTVCTGCATGCNVYADTKDGLVYRYRPRANPAVNGWWICDTGRYSNDQVNTDRILFATAGRGSGTELSRREAVALAAEELRMVRDAGGTIAVLGSPECTNEELWVLRQFADRVLGTPHLTGTALTPHGEADGVLRHPMLHPNVPGVRLVGAVPGTGGRDLPGLYDDPLPNAWLILNADPIGEADPATSERAAAALQAAESVVVFATHASATTALATVVLPGSMPIEQDGTMVAANGRLQRVRKAVEPRGDTRPDAWNLIFLGDRIGPREGAEWQWPRDPSARWLYRQMAAEVEELRDVRWEQIGDQGVDLGVGCGLL